MGQKRGQGTKEEVKRRKERPGDKRRGHKKINTNTNTNNLFPPLPMRYNEMHNMISILIKMGGQRTAREDK